MIASSMKELKPKRGTQLEKDSLFPDVIWIDWLMVVVPHAASSILEPSLDSDSQRFSGKKDCRRHTEKSPPKYRPPLSDWIGLRKNRSCECVLGLFCTLIAGLSFWATGMADLREMAAKYPWSRFYDRVRTALRQTIPSTPQRAVP